MNPTRRQFLRQAVTVTAGLAAIPSLLECTLGATLGLRFGTCMMGFEEARRAGFDGVEVSAGGPADRLAIANPATRQSHKDQARHTGLPVSSLMMGVFNECPLATDPRAPDWLLQGIEATHDLGANIILVAFFGNGDLLDAKGQLKKAEVDRAVARLQAAAPRAKEAGVTLAIENYLDARQNLEILDRIGHPSVKLYYDCFNTGGTRGYDVPSELRLLRDRVIQLHFKNGRSTLEQGKVRYAPIASALKEIRYQGWIVLETESPTGDRVDDGHRDVTYARGLFAG